MGAASRLAAALAAVALLSGPCSAAVVRETLVIEEWIVDYLRPTADVHGRWPWENQDTRKVPFKIKESERGVKYLINGSYPGPTIRANEHDMLEITVINKLPSESTTIHWHGIHPINQPYMDGAREVTQAPIQPDESFTYRFEAYPPGTHYYHSHMDAVQGSRGIRGPLIIERNDDPVKKEFPYDEDLVVFMSDEWRNPSECLMLEGAVPGNDVCADIRHGSFNGLFGNGTKSHPFPLITVEQGKCYRVRWIMGGSNTENFQITVSGHNMTLVTLDGAYDVKPIQVSKFNLHLGERVDVIMCADQVPGNYLIHAQYDYACKLVGPGHGNFIPPGFDPVPSCDFYAYLHYASEPDVFPKDLKGTGGGLNPRPVTGTEFDLTLPEGYHLTEPRVPEPEPEEPDVRYTINMGLIGPVYKNATDRPLTKGRWYMDLAEQNPPRSWKLPTTPLYHTKGKCGVDDIPVINVPESAKSVEIVIQNLSPNAHVLHMHGMPFKVINVANFTSWCGLEKTSCFLLPWWLETPLDKCPKENRLVGDPNHPDIEAGGYWGCKYDSTVDRATQNLKTPLIKDAFQIWQRSWAVLRFTPDRPGMWYFHCHETMHLMLGLQVVFNILPSKQPPVPADVPTSNTHECPTVNEARWGG